MKMTLLNLIEEIFFMRTFAKLKNIINRLELHIIKELINLQI